MLQDEAFLGPFFSGLHSLTCSLCLAIYNCGVHRDVAEAVVRVCIINDEELKKAVTSPSWALFNYWKSMSPNLQEQGCETGQYS